MKKFAKLLISSVLSIGFLVWSGNALAVAIIVNTSKNWSAITTGSGPGGLPSAADIITVSANRTLTVDVANGLCAGIQLGGTTNGSGNGTLSFNLGSQVSVSGAVTLGSGGGRTGSILMTNGGTLSLGSFNLNSLGTWTPGSGTVIFTATNTLPNNTNIDTFNNVTVNVGTTTLSRNIAVNGDLSVATGATLATAGGNALSVAGDFTVNGTLSGTGVITLSGTGTNIDGTGVVTDTATLDITTGAKTILSSAALSFSSRAIAIGNGLTVTNNGSVTSTGANGITGGNAGTTWTNAANSMLEVSGPLLATGILNASATGNTIHYAGAAQTIKLPSGAPATYYNLTLSGSGNKTPASATTFAINGTLTVDAAAVLVPFSAAQVISGTAALTGNGGTVRVSRSGTASGDFAGQYTMTGTKTLTNLTVAYQGTAAQFIDALSYGGLTMDNASGAALVGDTTVANILAFTQGNITTGSFTLADTANCATHTRVGGYVIGNIEMHIPAGASTCVFELGTGANYTPVSTTFAAGTTAGDITGNTSATQHPQIASSGIDSTQDVARFWTLTNNPTTPVTLPAAGYAAVFNWVAGDIVGAGNTGVFRAVQYSDSTWDPTVATANTATSITIGSEIGFGDFAVGEIAAYNDISNNNTRFNAFDTATLPVGAINGFLTTKVAGVPFAFDIISLTNQARANTTNGSSITVDLLDASDNTGAAPGTNNCKVVGAAAGNWHIIQSKTFNWTGGGSRMTLPTAFTEANSWPEVGVRVTNNNNGRVGCSADRFAIRPATLTVINVQDSDWTTAGTTRTLNNLDFVAANTVVHKAGQPFTISATAWNGAITPATTTNYAGSPTTVVSTCAAAGPPAACTSAFGVMTPGTWSASGGVVTTSTADYSEVGSFGLQLTDKTFSNVDLLDGSTAAQRDIPLSTTVDVGRFVPDHFDVVKANAPQFKTFDDTACSGRTFTYIGQPFGYVTVPTVTVTARNKNGEATTNYQNGWWRISAADVTQTYAPIPASPALNQVLGSPTVTPLNDDSGTGTITSNAGDKISFVRATTPQSLFNANVTLTVSVVDSSETSGDITTTAPTLFNGGGSGIAFDSGSEFRYGHLALSNAYGSELLALTVPIETQYWNGSVFVTNTADNCTSIAASNVTMNGYQKNLAVCETAVTGSGAVVVNGRGNLQLSAPGAGNNGGVDLRVNLGAATGNTCPAAVAVSANKAYLQGGATYSADPTSRATFGVYKSGPVIYMRSVY